MKFSENLIIPAKAESVLNATTLQIEIQPLDETYSPQLGFTWKTVEFSTSQVLIQLSFENPNYVSQTVFGLDKLRLQVLEPSLFISKKSFLPIEEDFEVVDEIQKQFSPEQDIESIASAASTT